MNPAHLDLLHDPEPAADALAFLLDHSYVGGKRFRIDRVESAFNLLIWRDGRACQAWRAPGPEVLGRLFDVAAPAPQYFRCRGALWCVEREKKSGSVHLYPVSQGRGPALDSTNPVRMAIDRCMLGARRAAGEAFESPGVLFLLGSALVIAIYAVFGVATP